MFACGDLLYADQENPPELSAPPAPLLAGPLISNTGHVIPYGKLEIEVYNNANFTTGTYDNHWHTVSVPNFFQYSLQIFGYFGLTPWMDIQVTPQFVCNATQGQAAAGFSDLPLTLDFQLYDSNASGYFPGIKVSFRETFPTGRYNNLDPHKLGTQVSGAGTYASAASIFFYKVYNTNGSHFMSVNLNFTYTMNTPVTVRGFNAYGGGYGCHGTVYPGSILQPILSFEYTLSTHWALALDNVYTHTFPTNFSGDPGVLADGSTSSVDSPSSDWLAFAPAIEYNFNSTYSLVAGVYLTAIGRNAPIFRNGIVEFEYNF